MAVNLTTDSLPLMPRFRLALEFASEQANRILAQYPGYSPMYTVGGKWNREGERWTYWCEGFFPGILWLLHFHTKDKKWAEAARQLSRPLERRRFDRTVHDLGFLFFSTYYREYNLTHDPRLLQILIDAGRTLAMRRQPGGYLASFIGPESLFIDIMMNVGLCLYAADATGDQVLRDIALEHCRTTARYLVRHDGGAAHEGIFHDGQFVRQSTHQGWSADSTWTRGQAWAIYGFTAVHRLADQPEFLDVARRCADGYLRRCPPDGVPVYDFDLPADQPQLVDSSASAIAASGLFDLAEALGEGGNHYRQAAFTMLATLSSDAYLARNDLAWEGILMHGIYHCRKNLGVDESVAWGEHFFVEALIKAVHGRSAAAWCL